MTQEELKAYAEQLSQLVSQMQIVITKVIPRKDMLDESQIKELK